MPPQATSSQPSQLSPTKTSRSRKSFILLAVLLLVAVGSAAYYYFYVNHSQPYKYKFVTLLDTRVEGPKKGQAMSFNRPVELTGGDVATDGSQGFAYSHGGGQAAFMAAGTLPFSQFFNEHNQTPTDTVANLADLSAKYYYQAIKPLQIFVAQQVAVGTTVSYGQAKPFSSQNIKDSSWQLDLTLKRSNSKQVDGRIVMAIGKNAVYLLMAGSANYNWLPNQAVWDQAFSSLKIDQQ